MSHSPKGRNACRMTEMPLSLGISRVSGETALNPGVSGGGGPRTHPVELPGCQAGSGRSGEAFWRRGLGRVEWVKALWREGQSWEGLRVSQSQHLPASQVH